MKDLKKNEPDDLKAYVNAHRSAFEVGGAPPDLWDDIEKRLEGKEQRRTVRMTFRYSLRAAASLTLLIVGLMGYGLYRFQQNPDPIASRYPEVQEMEHFYESQVQAQMQLVKQREVPAEVAEASLEELEKAYLDLKADLKDDADNQRVLEAMIQNYRLRLHVLNELLQRSKEADFPKNEPNHNETQL